MLKRYQHAPAHLLLDDTPYFITAAIYQTRPLLRATALKAALRETFQAVFADYGWQLAHWGILDTHYHLLGQSRRGRDLPRVMHDIHYPTAVTIQAATRCETPVWRNYWDYCLRTHADYMIRQNYLLYNPVKHGYVTDLREYPFSSFHDTFARLGRERLVAQFRQYPDYADLSLGEVPDGDL